MEGTPASYDPAVVAAAGVDKLRSTAAKPTEQVELELTVAGSQVSTYHPLNTPLLSHLFNPRF